MGWRSTPFVLLKVETENRSEELLPNCESLYYSRLFHMSALRSFSGLSFYDASALQKTDRVDDELINEMLRAVSFFHSSILLHYIIYSYILFFISP